MVTQTGEMFSSSDGMAGTMHAVFSIDMLGQPAVWSPFSAANGRASLVVSVFEDDSTLYACLVLSSTNNYGVFVPMLNLDKNTTV